MKVFVFLLVAAFVPATSFATVSQPCEIVKGKTFESVSEYPMGESPEGTVFGHRRATFSSDGGELSIREDDYTASGSYTCANPEGKIVLDKGESVGSWTGYYNAESDLLLLEGAWYRQSKLAADTSICGNFAGKFSSSDLKLEISVSAGPAVLLSYLAVGNSGSFYYIADGLPHDGDGRLVGKPYSATCTASKMVIKEVFNGVVFERDLAIAGTKLIQAGKIGENFKTPVEFTRVP